MSNFTKGLLFDDDDDDNGHDVSGPETSQATSYEKLWEVARRKEQHQAVSSQGDNLGNPTTTQSRSQPLARVEKDDTARIRAVEEDLRKATEEIASALQKTKKPSPSTTSSDRLKTSAPITTSTTNAKPTIPPRPGSSSYSSRTTSSALVSTVMTKEALQGYIRAESNSRTHAVKGKGLFDDDD